MSHAVSPTDQPERLPPTFESPTVNLRLWQREDAATAQALIAANLESLREFLPWADREPIGADAWAEQAAGWRDTWAAGGTAHYAICRPGSTEPVGGFAFHVEDGGVIDLGYWLDGRYRGRGLCSAAVRVATVFAHDVRGVTRTTITADVNNGASRGVAMRCGYHELSRVDRPADEATLTSGQEVVYALDALDDLVME